MFCESTGVAPASLSSATGTVTGATPTSLTIALDTDPTTAGSLTASVNAASASDNASGGTDHGAGGLMMALGSNVRGGYAAHTPTTDGQHHWHVWPNLTRHWVPMAFNWEQHSWRARNPAPAAFIAKVCDDAMPDIQR